MLPHRASRRLYIAHFFSLCLAPSYENNPIGKKGGIFLIPTLEMKLNCKGNLTINAVERTNDSFKASFRAMKAVAGLGALYNAPKILTSVG